MVSLFNLITWCVLGPFIMLTSGKNVPRYNYFLCWLCLVISLAINYFQ